ncbi:hypothetical protein E2C01_032223 [Portunus trituberculatus]|uniref:Uncharacterized protein n=1 Tax=Portunus trituberculatus TaxID=210409 RepID=A0A5B7EVH0_PORTR|nr:hypothetical protein [Portunus trituberculatus]
MAIVSPYYTRITGHHSAAPLKPSDPFDSRHRCHYTKGGMWGDGTRDTSALHPPPSALHPPPRRRHFY